MAVIGLTSVYLEYLIIFKLGAYIEYISFRIS